MLEERKLGCWVSSFVKYLEGTEIPPIFARWTAISLIAAALKKKVYFRYGRLKTYTNLYIVLVGPPGSGKSLSISFGKDILSQILDIRVAADITSKRALIDDLEQGSDVYITESGEEIKHSSLTVLTKEFEVFLGRKGQNEDMIMFLTDAFDCEELPYKYRTKHCGDVSVPSIYLNILGGTTPTSLSEVLPKASIGGGFSTRILFVYFDKEVKDVPIPEDSAEIRQLRLDLIHDLCLISSVQGVFDFSPRGKIYYTKWYMDERKRKYCTDNAFSGWYERKHLFLLKVATILQVSRKTTSLIDEDILAEAKYFLHEVETFMEYALRSIGKNLLNEETLAVLEILKNGKFISEKLLLDTLWRDLDGNKLDTIMQTLQRRKLVQMHTAKECKNGCVCGKKVNGIFWEFKEN